MKTKLKIEIVMQNIFKIIIPAILVSAPCFAQSSQHASPVPQKTVLLDNYFNHEVRKNNNGETIPFHYIWNDSTNSGFSLWGKIFRDHGLQTAMLETAPSPENLAGSSVYIIVDPDTKAETAHPNYISAKDAKVIYHWVKQGGVLVLMANDSGNCEFTRLNRLAQQFGITFNQDSRNHVKGNQFEQGSITIPPGNPVFPNTRKVFIKEFSSLAVSKKATPVLFNRDRYIVAAVSHVGHGHVIAIGDPWFYNEYTNGKKLPPAFQNAEAAADLTGWLLKKATTAQH